MLTKIILVTALEFHRFPFSYLALLNHWGLINASPFFGPGFKYFKCKIATLHHRHGLLLAPGRDGQGDLLLQLGFLLLRFEHPFAASLLTLLGFIVALINEKSKMQEIYNDNSWNPHFRNSHSNHRMGSSICVENKTLNKQ